MTYMLELNEKKISNLHKRYDLLKKTEESTYAVFRFLFASLI